MIIIWYEMSYNYYWAYRDLSLDERLQIEPDFQYDDEITVEDIDSDES